MTDASPTRLRIAGSLWSVPPEAQPELVRRAIEGGIDAIHWDFSDGTLGRAGGFTPSARARLMDGVSVGEEAHLMVRDPLNHVDQWTEWCELITVHVESRDWPAAVTRIQSRGRTAALAVSPLTPLQSIPRELSTVLVMSVEPGSAGSGFNSEALSRAAAVSQASTRSRIGLDGSVDLEHVRLARDRGVNWIVSGGALFNAGTPEIWISQARELWTHSPLADDSQRS